MNNHKKKKSNAWLLEHAGIPIRYNLLRLYNDPRAESLAAALLAHPEVQYWLDQLDLRQQQGRASDIHGSHDYRLENILGKLSQLGLRQGILPLDERMAVYRQRLADQVAAPREEKLSFGKMYSYYDGELIPAMCLALAGYFDPPVLQVAENRLDRLAAFAAQDRFDIYVDGSRYPGVKKEWQRWLIDPVLYADGQISLPTIHDCFLFSAVQPLWRGTPHEAQLSSVVDWLFDPRCQSIPLRYGYFYAPGGSYTAKAVCWKLPFPSPAEAGSRLESAFLLAVYLLSHFNASYRHPPFSTALQVLESFALGEGQYRFPKEYLQEKKDSYWVFGCHMGMGELRSKAESLIIESTYWMERIRFNLGSAVSANTPK